MAKSGVSPPGAENDRAPDADNTRGGSGRAGDASVSQTQSKFQQATTVVRRAPEFIGPVLTGRVTLATAFRQAVRHPEPQVRQMTQPVRPLRRPSGCSAGCGVVHECGVGEPIADLPPADTYQRGGRDRDLGDRDYIGRKMLARVRGGS